MNPEPGQSDAQREQQFTCPYCWQSITMVLDLTEGESSYVEDCEVCCHPIEIRFRAEDHELIEFDAQRPND